MVRSGSLNRICKVNAHFLHFQMITPDFFTVPRSLAKELSMKSNFRLMIRGDNETEGPGGPPIDEHSCLNQIAFTLFCALRACKLSAPIVRVIKGGDLSEKIAIKLSELWRKYPEEEPSQQRPLLLFLNRSNDLHSMLYHSWTYVTMLYDVFKPVNNKFTFKDEDPKSKPEEYELDF